MSKEHTITYRTFGRVKKIHDPMPHQWAFFYVMILLWIFLPAIIIIPIIILTDSVNVVYSWISLVILNLIWIWATVSKS